MSKKLSQLSPIHNVLWDFDLIKNILPYLDTISKIKTLSIITQCQESLRLELIKKILHEYPYGYFYLTQEDKNNKELIITALLKNSAVINIVPSKALYCFTRGEILKLISKDASLFKYISERHRHDVGIINLALQKNPKNWEIIPIKKKKKHIKKNLNLITCEDIINYPETIQFANNSIEQDINNFDFFSCELQYNL